MSNEIEDVISYIGWIKNKLIDLDYDKHEVKKLYKEYKKETDSQCTRESYNRKVREAFNSIMEDIQNRSDEELTEFVLKVESQKQKQMDKNRIVSKLNRENYRVFNLIDEMNREVLKALSTNKINSFKLTSHKFKPGSKVGIVTIADIHGGCNVEKNLNLGNEYNFTIIGNRMKVYIARVIEEFKNQGITNIIVVGLGDWISSQRRLSEKMTSAASLTRSILLVAHIIAQALVELQQQFNVSVVGVAGNESRLYDEESMSSADWLVSHNGDYMIFHILRQILSNTPIQFYESNFREIIVNINGANFLILHGDTLKSKNDIEKSIRDLVGSKILSGQVSHIDYVVVGHFHHCRISDFFCIVGSMMGADHYSGRDLHYTNRASQVILTVDENKVIEGKRIDLQNIYCEGVQGYEIKSELERYNIESKEVYNTEVIIRNLV
jgi:predicted phosphodiesterase